MVSSVLNIAEPSSECLSPQPCLVVRNVGKSALRGAAPAMGLLLVGFPKVLGVRLRASLVFLCATDGGFQVIGDFSRPSL